MSQPAAGPTVLDQPTAPRSWAAYAAALWVLPYLGIHLHAAITGSSWPLPNPPEAVRDVETGRVIEFGVCLVLIGAALTALSLVRPWGRIFPARLRLGAAYLGAIVGIGHAVIWSARGLARVFGGPVEAPPPGVSVAEMTAYVREYDRVNLMVNEPWFFGIGVLYLIAALQTRRALRAAGDLPPPAWTVARGWPAYAVLAWGLVTAATHLLWGLGGTLGQRVGLAEPDNQEEFLAQLRPVFLAIAVAALLGLAVFWSLLNGASSPAFRRAARVMAGVLVLGGLLTVLIGVMSFNAWIFALYGPWLMAGGIIAELALWHHRLRSL